MTLLFRLRSFGVDTRSPQRAPIDDGSRSRRGRSPRRHQTLRVRVARGSKTVDRRRRPAPVRRCVAPRCARPRSLSRISKTCQTSTRRRRVEHGARVRGRGSTAQRETLRVSPAARREPPLALGLRPRTVRQRSRLATSPFASAEGATLPRLPENRGAIFAGRQARATPAARTSPTFADRRGLPTPPRPVGSMPGLLPRSRSSYVSTGRSLVAARE